MRTESSSSWKAPAKRPSASVSVARGQAILKRWNPSPAGPKMGTVVQPEPGFVHNTAGQLVMGEPVGTEIHPEQIGPFRFHQAGVRQMGGEMVPEEIAVRGNIGLDFSKPGFPLVRTPL